MNVNCLPLAKTMAPVTMELVPTLVNVYLAGPGATVK